MSADPAPAVAPLAADRQRNGRRLSLRLAMLLSVALLPLGLIAVWQTTRIERELAEVNARDLIAMTAEVARQERETIQAALGAASALAAMMPDLTGEQARCSAVFRNFVDRSGYRFTFAGYLPAGDGPACGSTDDGVAMREDPALGGLLAQDGPAVTLDPSGPLTHQPVLVASVPVRGESGVPVGVVAVAIPQYRVSSPYADLIAGREMDLFTINSEGDVLTASDAPETAAMRLPADRPASALVDGPARFVARDGEGRRRIFSVVPIVERTVYAVGAWQPQRGSESGLLMRSLGSPALFPIIMWLASLTLVYMAVERQVVRHIRALAGQMRRFSRTRELPEPSATGTLPGEIAEIEREFSAMANHLLRDEAELMDAMHDKDVLLKEVHHRVKNNLQLISSIVNMQARRTAAPETAAALESVNRRVISMATVHRRLYEAENLGRVRADELLHDVIAPLGDLARPGPNRPTIGLRLDPVVLTPDQAVPVALLAVEAVTNALKYCAPDRSGACWLRVSLTDLGADELELVIESSTGPEGAAAADPALGAQGTGLGSQLIRAFARQLEAGTEIAEAADSYTLRLHFQAAPFASEPQPAASG